MSTATERLVGGDQLVSAPSIDAAPEQAVSPEWHSLRLFGDFLAGAETRDEF